MFKTHKHITKFILTFALALSLKANAQEVRVIDNKGTIQNVNNNRVFTQATDPNPSLPTPPITVQGDIWFNSSVTPSEMNVWNGTSWVTVSTQNNAWLKANSTDIPTSIDDNIYTNGRIGINDDNPDFAIKVITQSEGIDQFLRFETDDSDDFLEISNTTGTANTLAGGFIGGTRSANRSSLNFFGDSEVSDDLATSEPIIKFFTRIGSNNSSSFGSGATTVANRPLFDFINHNDSKFKILANGNTGIDVDTPTEKLHINGKVRINDIETVTTTNEILTTDATGVVQKKTLVDTQSNNSITNGANGGVYYNSPIKAMGKINADGTIAKITTDYTVTKLGGNGRYQINIPTAQQTDANYIIQLTPFANGTGNNDYIVISYYNQTTASFRVEIKNFNGNRRNKEFMFTILNF